MNLNYLQTLLAVREYGNFSAAARQIGLTQPAVSLQIQSLEDEFGAKLVVRNARTCELTPAGEVLVQFADDVFAKLRETQSLVSQLTGEISGPVRIGASNTPGEYILPRLLASFMAEYPQVRLHLEIGDSEQIMDWLENKRIDFGVIGSLPVSARATASHFADDELLIVVSPEHCWAGQTISPELLLGSPFVTREPGSGTRETYERALALLGLAPEALQTVLVVGSSSAVLCAVQAGVGFAFCSRWAVADLLALQRLAAVRVPGLCIRRSFSLVAHPDRFRTPAAEKLLTKLSIAAQELRQRGE